MTPRSAAAAAPPADDNASPRLARSPADALPSDDRRSAKSPPMILLTGATGYIGSHTWLALHAAAMPVVGVDDFSNSSPGVLRRLEALGADVSRFAQVDVTDRAMLAHGCKRIVFSSSASVYGQPRSLPVREDAALEPGSPYASSKLMSENIL